MELPDMLDRHYAKYTPETANYSQQSRRHTEPNAPTIPSQLSECPAEGDHCTMTWRISLNNRVFFFERKIKSQVRPVRNGLKVGCNLYRPLCFKIQKKGLREPYTWPTFLPIFTIISSRRTKITICYKLVFNKKKQSWTSSAWDNGFYKRQIVFA